VPRHDDPTEIEPRPTAPPPPGARSNPDALRADIDSGVTGDKVPVIDPAATPLGTDAEAAGAPPAPELVAAVRRAEREGAPRPSPLDPTDSPRRGGTARLIAGVLLVLAALGLGAAWIGLAD
jgi:hypothetical protein